MNTKPFRPEKHLPYDELLEAFSEAEADNDRLRDLVVKFQSGKPSTLYLEGHLE